MIAIVDYGVGNLSSITNMFKKVGVQATITSSAAQIRDASKIILPGMGAFDNCMRLYHESGIGQVVSEKVLRDKVPFLGICVGLQMLMSSSQEGALPGLGWINGETVRFNSVQMTEKQKIPNMGWLDIHPKKLSPLMDGLEDARFYFAHSYHVKESESSDALATAHYGYDFTVAIERDNIMGVQFHPEKSHRFGMRLLKNFAENY
jgi:imidazole glycerol-phosphate synthase subunit HisH